MELLAVKIDAPRTFVKLMPENEKNATLPLFFCSLSFTELLIGSVNWYH